MPQPTARVQAFSNDVYEHAQRRIAHHTAGASAAERAGDLSLSSAHLTELSAAHFAARRAAQAVGDHAAAARHLAAYDAAEKKGMDHYDRHSATGRPHPDHHGIGLPHSRDIVVKTRVVGNAGHRAEQLQRPHAVVQSAHGAHSTGTAHDQAMHQAVQRGKKGGAFVVTATGKKRYVKK